jgi:two-component system sensor histidine kinase AlgZ
MVFTVVIIGELLAFIFTLAPLELGQQSWNDLALISLFIQWNGLLGCAVLCLLRPKLANLSNQFAAVCSLFILFVLQTLISEITYALINYYGIIQIVISGTHWEFLLHNLLIGGIISALALRYFYVQYQWKLKIQSESSARLQLLQARIRPHFLFNSLNTIASLTRTRPAVAERIIEDLAELLRILFKADHDLISWPQELMFAQRYIDIEAQRLGERLVLDWQVDDIPADAMVPDLMLQPLLENAIYHGIEPNIQGGVIQIIGKITWNRIEITIENPQSVQAAHRKGNQLALNNIRQRLEAHYPDSASIEIDEQDESFIVILSIPYQKKNR